MTSKLPSSPLLILVPSLPPQAEGIPLELLAAKNDLPVNFGDGSGRSEIIFRNGLCVCERENVLEKGRCSEFGVPEKPPGQFGIPRSCSNPAHFLL